MCKCNVLQKKRRKKNQSRLRDQKQKCDINYKLTKTDTIQLKL